MLAELFQLAVCQVSPQGVRREFVLGFPIRTRRFIYRAQQIVRDVQVVLGCHRPLLFSVPHMRQVGGPLYRRCGRDSSGSQHPQFDDFGSVCATVLWTATFKATVTGVHVGLFVLGYGGFRCARSGSWRTRAGLESRPTCSRYKNQGAVGRIAPYGSWDDADLAGRAPPGPREGLSPPIVSVAIASRRIFFSPVTRTPGND